MTYNLLRREWLQYKSFGRTWLWIWVLYLGMYLLLGMAAGFVVVFLPIIMAYSAIYSAKQTGEAVNAGTEDFLLPVPLRDVLWAKYLFAFLMGSASAVVVLAAVLFQTLLNPEEAINPFYVLGVTMTYTAVITGVGCSTGSAPPRHASPCWCSWEFQPLWAAARQWWAWLLWAACPIRSALP